MRQHNIWCVCVCSIWRGMPEYMFSYIVTLISLTVVVWNVRLTTSPDDEDISFLQYPTPRVFF